MIHKNQLLLIIIIQVISTYRTNNTAVFIQNRIRTISCLRNLIQTSINSLILINSNHLISLNHYTLNRRCLINKLRNLHCIQISLNDIDISILEQSQIFITFKNIKMPNDNNQTNLSLQSLLNSSFTCSNDDITLMYFLIRSRSHLHITTNLKIISLIINSTL